MNLGAEPKKVAILAGLVVVGLGVYYLNSSGDSTPAPASRAIAPPDSQPDRRQARSAAKAPKVQTGHE